MQRISRRLAKSMSKSDKRMVLPNDHTLQIDCDSRAALKNFYDRLAFFKSRIHEYGLGWTFLYKIHQSSPKHYHITVTLSQRMNLCERILAQTLLGDDPNRAMFNFFRYLNGSRVPVLFFEKRKV